MEQFDKMQIPKIAAYSQENESLSISVFNGKVNMTIFPPRDSGQKGIIHKLSLTLDGFAALKKVMKKVAAGQPGNKTPMIFQKYNRDAKKYEHDSALIFGKDEKQVFFFEFQFTHNGNSKSIKFDMKCPNSMTVGADIMSDAEKSSIRMAALYIFLDDIAPTAMLLSGKKYNPNGYKKSGGGGGGGNSGGGNSGGGDGGSSFGGGDAAF
jgi:uncharacterized membrane protein YgcG